MEFMNFSEKIGEKPDFFRKTFFLEMLITSYGRMEVFPCRLPRRQER